MFGLFCRQKDATRRWRVSARAPVRSGNPDWLPDSAGRVAGSPRTYGKCGLNRGKHAGARAHLLWPSRMHAGQ
eukprot:5915287-Prymnesium_polylepis.1